MISATLGMADEIFTVLKINIVHFSPRSENVLHFEKLRLLLPITKCQDGPILAEYIILTGKKWTAIFLVFFSTPPHSSFIWCTDAPVGSSGTPNHFQPFSGRTPQTANQNEPADIARVRKEAPRQYPSNVPFISGSITQCYAIRMWHVEDYSLIQS